MQCYEMDLFRKISSLASLTGKIGEISKDEAKPTTEICLHV
jgi:hypothetical protein